MKRLAATLWTLTIAFWVFLFVITHIPQVRVPRVPMTDKTAHLIAYFILALMLGLSMWASNPNRRGILWRVLVICVVYGAFDELTQDLVGRYCETRDFIFDTIGTLAACAVLALLGLLHRARDKTLESKRIV